MVNYLFSFLLCLGLLSCENTIPERTQAQLQAEVDNSKVLLKEMDTYLLTTHQTISYALEKLSPYENDNKVKELANLNLRLLTVVETNKDTLITKDNALIKYFQDDRSYYSARVEYLYKSIATLHDEINRKLLLEIENAETEELLEKLYSLVWAQEHIQEISIIIILLEQLFSEIEKDQNPKGPFSNEENNKPVYPKNPEFPLIEIQDRQTPIYSSAPQSPTCTCTLLDTEYAKLVKAFQAYTTGLGNKFRGCLDITQDLFLAVYLKVKPVCWGPGIAWRLSIYFNALTCISNFMHNAFMIYPRLSNCGYRDDIVFDPYIFSETFSANRTAKIQKLTDFVIEGDCGGGVRDQKVVSFGVEKRRAQQCINTIGHDKSFCKGAYVCLNKEYGYDRPQGKRKRIPLKNSCPKAQ